MFDLSAALASLPKNTAPAPACARAALATRTSQAAKTAIKTTAIQDAGGDPDAITEVTYWVPRESRRKLFATGYLKKFVGSDKRGDDEDHDDKHQARAIVSHSRTEYEAEVTESDYVLVTCYVPRARPPHEERTHAQFEGRYQPENHGGASFFAPAQIVRYGARVEQFSHLDNHVGEASYVVTDATGEVLPDVPSAERQVVRNRHAAALQTWGR